MITRHQSISYVLQLSILILLLLLVAPAGVGGAGADGVTYIDTPMHGVSQTTFYITMSDDKEVVVAHAGKGSDLKKGDKLTHADGIRIIAGEQISDFVGSDEKQVLVPIIDDSDEKFGGHRFLSFLLVQTAQPRKLTSRRGELQFDLNEGGDDYMKLQSASSLFSAEDLELPPHGGGKCLSGQDCFFRNGTCSKGSCNCIPPYTGTYCQLFRPEYASSGVLNQKKRKRDQQVWFGVLV